jgi:hypothetical protein
MESASEEAKAHLFISYAREDRRVVDWIAARLETSGYTVWIDRTGILGGAAWQRVIPREIRRAEAVLLVLSPHAVKSEWVRREFSYALRNRVRVIPIIVRPAEPAPEMKERLAKIQSVTLWNRRKKGFAELLTALGGLRGVAAQVPGPFDQTALHENTSLIAELLRIVQEVTFGVSNAIFHGGEDWEYYIQLVGVRDDADVYAEAVGNRNLDPPRALDEDQIATLRDFGWEEPDKTSAGNYRRTWEVRSDHDRTVIAGAVMRTFLDVYRHPPGEHLEIEVQLS